MMRLIGIAVLVAGVAACGDDSAGTADAAAWDATAAWDGPPADAPVLPDAATDAAAECPYYVGQPCRTVDQGCYGGLECYFVYLAAVCGPPDRSCAVDAGTSCTDASQTCYLFPAGGDSGGICLTDLEKSCFCQGATGMSRPTWCE
jgi:hypothetical protein